MTVTIILGILIFFLGASAASFFGVITSSSGIRKIKRKRSQCDNCAQLLFKKDLIPIMSYFILKGRCRFCQKDFSRQHLIHEFIGGVSFLALWASIVLLISTVLSIDDRSLIMISISLFTTLSWELLLIRLVY